MTTQIATDTELSAVNSILGSIGQSPVTTLGTVTTDATNTGQEIANTFANPQIAMIHGLLMEVTKDVQNEGWHFNKEDHVKISVTDNGIGIPKFDRERIFRPFETGSDPSVGLGLGLTLVNSFINLQNQRLENALGNF